MLKKIPVSQLRLGMHLHALDGTWLDPRVTKVERKTAPAPSAPAASAPTSP